MSQRPLCRRLRKSTFSYLKRKNGRALSRRACLLPTPRELRCAPNGLTCRALMLQLFVEAKYQALPWWAPPLRFSPGGKAIGGNTVESSQELIEG